MAGHTKKALSIALYNAGSSVGNIVGPLLFKAEDAPRYRSGVVAVLGIFVAAAGICAGLVVLFMILNKRKERIRVANGKPAKLVDRSMDAKYSAQVELQEGEEGYGGVRLGDQAFMDLTDHKNDEVSCSDSFKGRWLMSTVHLHILSWALYIALGLNLV